MKVGRRRGLDGVRLPTTPADRASWGLCSPSTVPRRLIERLGVAAVVAIPTTLHMLRHAAGYALAGRGIDTRTLQSIHGAIVRSRNTVVYTAVADKRIRNIW